MKKFVTMATALSALWLSTPVWAMPEHSSSTEATSEVSVAHRAAVEAAPSHHPVHLHTINGRSRDAGRLQEAPAPGQGRQVTMMSTAYCLRGMTSRGTGVEYGTIAVDPRIIPLGSRVYIPGYGWGRALDTGGAIRGNVVDLWFPTSGQCFQWGCRKVTVTVFDDHHR